MTDHDIPPLLPLDQMPPIADQASLERTWRALMGELGFAGPQLWMMFLMDGRCLRLVKTEDVPEHPSRNDTEAVLDMVRHISDDPASCAYLYARPGRRGLTDGDLAWARGLSTPGGWPVHVANDHQLQVVAPDDLAATG